MNCEPGPGSRPRHGDTSEIHPLGLPSEFHATSSGTIENMAGSVHVEMNEDKRYRYFVVSRLTIERRARHLLAQYSGAKGMASVRIECDYSETGRTVANEAHACR